MKNTSISRKALEYTDRQYRKMVHPPAGNAFNSLDLDRAFIAGYRAAQRDARKGKGRAKK